MYRRSVGFCKLVGLKVAGGKKECVAHEAALRVGMIELADCIGAFVRLIDELFDVRVVSSRFAAAI